MNNAYDKFASHARMHAGNSISCTISSLDSRYVFGPTVLLPDRLLDQRAFRRD